MRSLTSIGDGPPKAERLVNLGVAVACVGIPIQQLIVLPRIGPISNVLIPVGLLIAGLGLIEGARAAPASRTVIWLATFVAWAIASYFWSPNPEMSTQRAFTYFQLLMFLTALTMLTTTVERRIWAISGYVAGAYLVAFTMIVNFITDNRVSQVASAARYAAGLANANRTAATLVVGFAFATYLTTSSPRYRVLWIPFVCIAPFAILITASRTGLLGLGASTAVILVHIGWNRGRRLQRLTLIAVVGLAALVFVPQSSLNRMTTFSDDLAGGESAEIRAGAIDVGIDAFIKHPAIGTGSGSFSTLMNEAGLVATVAHNSLISIAAELGIIGLVLYLGALISATRPALAAGGNTRWFALLLIAAALPSFLLASFEDDKVTWIVIAMLAATSAEVSMSSRAPSKTSGSRPTEKVST